MLSRSGVHVTLESLIKDNELISTIKDLVRESGRSHPKVQTVAQAKRESAVPSTEKQQVTNGKENVPLDIPKDPLAVR